MNVQCIGQSSSKFYRYLNDVIIKPTHFLIKEESQLLSLENEELKRNNEDLTNRIDKMFQEFDIMAESSSRISEKFSKAIIRMEKNNKNHKKIQKSHKFDKVSKNTYVTNNDSQSYDSVDAGMHDIKSKEDASKLYIKNKELENCKSENLDLTKQLDDIKNQNKKLKAECKVITKSLKNCRENEDISVESIINESNLPQRSSSPIYVDIFDTPEKALKFKIENKKNRQLINNETKSSLLSQIYSEIPEVKHDNNTIDENNFDNNDHTRSFKHNSPKQLYEDNLVLSEEIRQGFTKLNDQLNRKYDELNCNITRKSNTSLPNTTENGILLDSVRSSTVDLLNISEIQKSIVDLISKNSDILTSLQERKSIVPIKVNSKATQYLENSKRNEACQTSIESTNDKQSISADQMGFALKDSFQILQKINEQNSKIENLAENLSLIVNKTDEIKVTSTNNIIKSRSHADLENSSLLNNDLNVNKDLNVIELSKSSECLLSNQDEIRKESNHKSTGLSFNSFDEFDTKDNNDENLTKIHEMNNKLLKTENINKNSKNEVLVQKITPSLFETPKPTSLSKIPKLIDNSKHTSISKSVDKLEIMYSSNLESSYETLYDPIFSARSVINDENTINV